MKDLKQLEKESVLEKFSSNDRAIIEHCLGYCYENGVGGLNQDPQKAFNHYLKAFELHPEWPDYARSISSCYRRGFGVETNFDLSKYFHSLEDSIIFGKEMPMKPRIEF